MLRRDRLAIGPVNKVAGVMGVFLRLQGGRGHGPPGSIGTVQVLGILAPLLATLGVACDKRA